MRDSKFGVLQVLFKPDTPGDRFEDMAAMIWMCGKAIGCSTDGKRTFHVLDGRLYVVWPGVDISSMDYFDFCQTLRERPPAGRVLDFVPHSSFHLGHPGPMKIHGVEHWLRPDQSGSPDPNDRPANVPYSGSPRQTNEDEQDVLADLNRRPDPRTAMAGQEAQISGKWVLAYEDGTFVRGFSNTRAGLEAAAGVEGAMTFDSMTDAEKWKRRYATGYRVSAMPADAR